MFFLYVRSVTQRLQIGYLTFPQELRKVIEVYIYIMCTLVATMVLTPVRMRLNTDLQKFMYFIDLLKSSVCYT